MYKLISSCKKSDDLSVGFHQDNTTPERKLNGKNETKGNYHDRYYLINVFDCAEHQENTIYGLFF